MSKLLLTFLTSLPRGPGRTPSPSGTSFLKRLLKFVCLFVISYVISSLFQVSKPSAAKPSADKPAKAKVRRAEYLKPMSTTKPGVWHKVAGRSSKVCLFVCYFICYLLIISGCQVFHQAAKPHQRCLYWASFAPPAIYDPAGRFKHATRRWRQGRKVSHKCFL